MTNRVGAGAAAPRAWAPAARVLPVGLVLLLLLLAGCGGKQAREDAIGRGDSTIPGDSTVLSDSTMLGDSTIPSDSTILGDSTISGDQAALVDTNDADAIGADRSDEPDDSAPDARSDLVSADGSLDALADDADVAPEHNDADVTPEPNDADVAPEPNDADVAPEPNDADVTPEPDDTDLWPEPADVDLATSPDSLDAAPEPADADAAPEPDGSDLETGALDGEQPDGELDSSDDAAGDSDDLPDGGVASCLSPAYQSYFAQNPSIAAATLGRLDVAQLQAFCQALAELETSGKLVVPEPLASKNCVEPSYCYYIALSDDERRAIIVAKYAHAVWLDAKATLPWRLSDYSAEQLDELFDPQILFRNGSQFQMVVDHSPSEAYAYMLELGLVKTDRLSTLIAVVEDLRSTDAVISFVHGLQSSDPTTTAYTVNDALRTWVDRGIPARISRAGCHSMTRIVLALLRSVNIPGREVHDGSWYVNLHSTAVWSVFQLALTHGDNLYSATLRAAPPEKLLTPFAFFGEPQHTAVCGTSPSCLAERYLALQAVSYPANYTVQRCCKPAQYNLADCHEYLTTNFGTTLTGAEIDAAASSIEALCN